MTSRRRVVVATASYGGGHHEIAEAVIGALRARQPSSAAVATIDLLERCAPRSSKLARVAYAAAEDFFPEGSGDLAALAAEGGDDPLVGELLGAGMSSAEAALVALEPHAVLAVHPVAGGIASELRPRLGCPVATIVPSLGEEARLWAHPRCDLWFAATAEVRDSLVRRGVEWSSVVVSGVPAREGNRPSRGALGLEDRFTAAVIDTGRADGRAIVAAVAARGVQVVTTLSAAPAARGRRQSRSVVVAPETTLADLTAVADVVVSGPCGASQWSAPAAGTPLIAVCPIPALDGPSVRVLSYSGAALVARDPEEAGEQAAYLMRHPERLASMRLDASNLGRPTAARVVVERVFAAMS